MKKVVEHFLKDKLRTNPEWQKRALVVIYNRQTADEKVYKETIENNNKGFTGADAPILTSLAQFYLSKNFLTEKQMGLLSKKISKYWRQVWEEADQNKILKMAEEAKDGK